MPNIGDTITLSLPTVGDTQGPTYATEINQAITDLKDILEQKIPLSSLTVTQDLSMRNGTDYYELVDVQALSMLNGAAAPSGVANASVYFYGNELYALDGAGNEVALTAAGSPTGSTATNGIQTTGTPAYNDNGEVIDWHGTNQYYSFYDGSSSFADIRAKQAFLTEDDTYFAKLKSPTLTGDITLTLPDVAASSNEILTISSAGAITAGSAVNGFSLVSGQSLTLAGAGRVKHGIRYVAYNPNSSGYGQVTASYTPGVTGVTVAATGSSYYIEIPATEYYKQIEQWTLYVTKVGTATMTANLYQVNNVGTRTLIGSDTEAVAGAQSLTDSTADNQVINSYYYLEISGFEVGDVIEGLVVAYSGV